VTLLLLFPLLFNKVIFRSFGIGKEILLNSLFHQKNEDYSSHNRYRFRGGECIMVEAMIALLRKHGSTSTTIPEQ